MQDLTFGEQVKIVLNRRNMTIKDLARKIESRTKKKMSRQNLTQRLGRDNFQEQDMRMIADILGCPFQLNILEDRTVDEKAETGIEEIANGQNASVKELSGGVNPQGAGQTEREDRTEKEMSGQTDMADRTEKEMPGQPDRGDKPEKEISGQPDKNDKTEMRLSERRDMEKPAEVAAEEKDRTDKTGTVDRAAGTSVHERDMTIGEFVDINEELDAMLKEAAGNQAKLQEQDGKEGGRGGADPSGEEEKPVQTADRPTGRPSEHFHSELAESGLGEHTVVDQGNTGIGYGEGHGGTDTAVGEGYRDESGEAAGEGYRGGAVRGYGEGYGSEHQERAESVYQEGYLTEAAAGSGEGYPAHGENESVEHLLQEIESLEKTEKKEEKKEDKPHGWRAYFMQRIMRRGKEQAQQEENAASVSAGKTPGTGVSQRSGSLLEEGAGGTIYQTADHQTEGYSEAEYDKEGYVQSGYAEPVYGRDGYEEGNYAGPVYDRERRVEGSYAGPAYGGKAHAEGSFARLGYTREGQPENVYAQAGYDGEAYSYGGYAGQGHAVEGYAEDGYLGDGYKRSGYPKENYPEEEYAVEGYGDEYLTEETQSGYQESQSEEEEDTGDTNPYTGKEYESNSVRMHPSRIGYVQVYDRTIHKWTDMTEWAFLGYQERKKQLLGKDYDPPIYLD